MKKEEAFVDEDDKPIMMRSERKRRAEEKGELAHKSGLHNNSKLFGVFV